MKVAILYFKDPLSSRTGMDLIRWYEIGHGLSKLGNEVDLISPETVTTKLEEGLWARNIKEVNWKEYNVVKTRNQSDILMVPDHNFIISRIGRVVDDVKPAREFAIRSERLLCQQEIHKRAKYVVFTCQENIDRWNSMYQGGPEPLLIPTGCPSNIPKPGNNPYKTKRNVIFLGSLTSSRFVERLNKLGQALNRKGIHLYFMGRNQLDLYGETDEELNPEWVTVFECRPEEETWDFLFFADVGVTFARGTDVFDNDSSKIYYYLRAGLPTVSEDLVASNFLLAETKYGAVAEYENIQDMVLKISEWIGKKSNHLDVEKYMVDHHSWINRAAILDRVFRKSGEEAKNGDNEFKFQHQ